MTAFTRTPQNTNLLQPTKFLLTFDRIPAAQYFCQSANVPGVNLGQAPINTPFVDINSPGNKITYNPFSIRFTVDEKLEGWRQLHDWYRAIASPEGFAERNRLSSMQSDRKSGSKAFTDATLTILSNLNNPVLRIQFINMFPITLSDIVFDTTQSADDIMTADAVFMFDYFNILDV